MKLKNKFVVSVFAFSCFAVTGSGVFASGQATQSSIPLLPEIVNDAQLDGSFLPSILKKLPFKNLDLNPDQKRHFQELWTAFKLAQKQMIEKMQQAATLQEKEALRIERDAKQLDFQSQLLAFLPEQHKSQLKELSATKLKKSKETEKTDTNSTNGEEGYGFLWSLLDQNGLTSEQKYEIRVLEMKKQKAMQELVQKIASLSTSEMTTLEQEIEQVNTEFLTALKKYISEDKLQEYLEFLGEIQQRNSKVKTKPVQSS
ncbi:MAG: hypothetical protein HXJ92_02875 [candidate division SR1 bacterium]|nr:hypothetical protein [candidate division SR1 bacterium]